MKLSDFDFDLPKELIAQEPSAFRDESRLLIGGSKSGATGEYIETKFLNIVDFLEEGDLIIFNDSKVFKSKLVLYREDKKIDLNLSHNISSNTWLGFARPSKKLTEGDEFEFGNYKLIIRKKFDMGEVEIEITGGEVSDFLEIYGSTPLPPYIKKGIADSDDDERYQTIYANTLGSCAAPTAGLHFTDHVFEKLHKKGVEIDFVTLHVGAGTFLPVKTENILEHKMHYEEYYITPSLVEKIAATKASGKRVIAVGTTTMRTLESFAMTKESSGKTNIFITPGFEFKIVDALITNFHLPKSTLLMLVSAFAGYEKIMDMYKFAIENEFRFFSYGDAMFLQNMSNDRTQRKHS
ncbi:MAG: tRNA preQ1(34) S-adenosylmethionine ribosyltransferase-isomerase QueA [Pseudomonadota bacterium]